MQQRRPTTTDNSHLYNIDLVLQCNRPITANISCHSYALRQSTTIIQQDTQSHKYM